MQIFVQQNGQQTGPYPIEQIRTGLAAGTYQPTDLAWHEGMADWIPLSTIPAVTSKEPPAMPVSAPAKNHPLAIWSMVLGILSLLCLGLTGLPAIICGHMSLSRIKKSAGRQAGSGFAIAGLVTGYIGFFIVGLAGIAGLTAPLIIRQRKKADQVEAINNARQIGMALAEFEVQYGSLPTAATAAKVADDTQTETVTGNSSNARFRQLLRSGIFATEMPFYAKASGIHKPDNLFDGAQALQPGECAFAYIESKSTANRPLAIAPMVPGTDRFDPQPFDNKAIILWTDGSVTSLPIDRSTGRVIAGKDPLDPSNPIWSGTPPAIALPE